MDTTMTLLSLITECAVNSDRTVAESRGRLNTPRLSMGDPVLAVDNGVSRLAAYVLLAALHRRVVTGESESEKEMN